MANSINKSLPQPIAEEILKSLLDAMWPGLQQKIEAVPKRQHSAKSTRTQADILEELVAGVRGFDSRLRETEFLFSEQGIRRRRKPRFFMPIVLDMAFEAGGSDPIGLLVIAGALRDDVPWLSEVLAESYRELRRAGPRSYDKIIERINHLTRALERGPFLEELGASKDVYVLIKQLPIFLERYFERLRITRSPASQQSSEPERQQQNKEKGLIKSSD